MIRRANTSISACLSLHNTPKRCLWIYPGLSSLGCENFPFSSDKYFLLRTRFAYRKYDYYDVGLILHDLPLTGNHHFWTIKYHQIYWRSPWLFFRLTELCAMFSFWSVFRSARRRYALFSPSPSPVVSVRGEKVLVRVCLERYGILHCDQNNGEKARIRIVQFHRYLIMLCTPK